MSPTGTPVAPSAPVAPTRFDEWGSYFDDYAATYERSAFGAAGLAHVGDREAAVVMDALQTRTPGRVLDAGAGTGRIARLLDAAGWGVTALDVSAEMLGGIRRTLPRCETVHAALGSSLPLADASFDAVVSMRVLKYVAPLDVALAEFARVLKPRGVAVLEFANRRSAARFGYGNAPVQLLTAHEALQRCERAGIRIHARAAGTRLPYPVWNNATTRRRASIAVRVERALELALGGRRSTAGARSLILVGERE
jgi:ubiquinone/menaquinone biosynthesis C-methylase UbiE